MRSKIISTMKYSTGMSVLSLGFLVYLALVTGCSHDNPLPETAYEKAPSDKGGIMYDKFWANESGFDQADPNLATFNDKANFFRCKQCHAWDGLGNAGSYINRAPSTTRPNVSSLNIYEMAKQKSPQELFDALKKTTGRRDIKTNLSTYDPATNNTEGDKMPDLTQILTDKQIWSLVKFMKEGMFDVSQLYDAQYQGAYPTGTATYSNIGLNGDAAMGNIYFNDNCAACHGTDGLDLDLSGLGVGGFIRSKPNELQHKTKYGQLGSSPAMVGEFDITLDEMRNLYKALSDETSYPDKPLIPTNVSFAIHVEPIFYTDNKCTACHPPTLGLDLTQGNAYNSINDTKYINLAAPASSLIYTKPQGSHPKTFTSLEAATILRWIEQGALDN